MESVTDKNDSVPTIDCGLLDNATILYMDAWNKGDPVTFAMGDDGYTTAVYAGNRSVTTKEFSRESFKFLGADLEEFLTEPGGHYFIGWISVNASREGFIFEVKFYKKL